MSIHDPFLSPTSGSSSVNPFSSELQGYWDRRLTLFSLFNNGIRIDEEGLYSVKPELCALEIAQLVQGEVVLDAFCGVGGSAIGFARLGKTVLATDTDAVRLRMAEHNAHIYGCEESISFFHLDAAAAIEQFNYSSVYFDPPWGGPSYTSQTFFSFASFNPNPKPLIEAVLAKRKQAVITVPLNFDFREATALHFDQSLTWSRIDRDLIFATLAFAPDTMGK